MESQKTARLPFLVSEAGREIGAVLFDMDGVLVDSVPIHIAAWNATFRENDLPALDRDTYLSMLGRTNLEMVALFAERRGKPLSSAERRRLIETKEGHFREIIREKPKRAPGALTWLKFFRKNRLRCSVASSGEMANIITVLQSLGISDYFGSILSGAHLPASKPDPMIFTLAAASLGVKAENCMVIEDAPAGIRAAKAANMLCCALATSFPLDQLDPADIMLENLAQTDPGSLFRTP